MILLQEENPFQSRCLSHRWQRAQSIDIVSSGLCTPAYPCDVLSYLARN